MIPEFETPQTTIFAKNAYQGASGNEELGLSSFGWAKEASLLVLG
jgi:hypothetical protein